MRHTLLPIDLKRSLRHDYRIRATIVFLFMLSISGLVGIVSLLPSFIHAMVEKISSEKNLAPLTQNVEKDNNADIFMDVAKQASYIFMYNDNSGGKTNFSRIIQNIVEQRGSVKIISLVVSRTSTSTVLTVIQGIAPNRESLLSFKERLENGTSKNIVNLPVSPLKDSKDIKFSMSILNDQTP